MSTVEAMNKVNALLDSGELAAAQTAVLANESVLPASVFERVLKAAVASNMLTADYARFCDARFGRGVFANMVWEAVA